jgi:hypothetical protein
VPLVPPLSLSRSCTLWLSTSQPRGQRSRGSPNPGTLVQHPRAGSQADFKARCIYDSTLHTVDHQTTSSRNCHLSAPVSAPTLVPPLCHNTATALCTALALLIQSAHPRRNSHDRKSADATSILLGSVQKNPQRKRVHTHRLRRNPNSQGSATGPLPVPACPPLDVCGDCGKKQSAPDGLVRCPDEAVEISGFKVSRSRNK